MLQTDASSVGVGAVLEQGGRVTEPGRTAVQCHTKGVFGNSICNKTI